VIEVKEKQGSDFFNWFSVAIVFLSWLLAFLIGFKKPIDQFYAMFSALGFLLGLCLLLAIFSKIAKKDFKEKIGRAALHAFFALLSQGTIVALSFFLVAGLLPIAEEMHFLEMAEALVFPAAYLVFLCFSQPLSRLIKKVRWLSAILLITAFIFLFISFAQKTTDAFIFLALFGLFISPICINVLNEEIPLKLRIIEKGRIEKPV